MRSKTVLYLLTGILLATISALSLTRSGMVKAGPPTRGSATERQQTIDAVVNQRFTQTAQTQHPLDITKTTDAPFPQVLTATAAFNATVDARLHDLLTTTVQAMLTPSLTYAEQVSQARQKWLAQGITSYRLVLSFYEAFAVGRKSQREVLVKRGQVVSSSCVDDTCPAFVLRDVFTIDDLFEIVQGASLEILQFMTPLSPENCLQRIAFDATYGFPKTIAFDCPQVYDDDHWVEVVAFEVLNDDTGSK